jgi:hypothetical protein
MERERKMPVEKQQDDDKLSERFYNKAQEVLDAITPEKIADSKAVDLARMAGIMHEHARIASGKASQAVLSITGTVAELARLRQKGELNNVIDIPAVGATVSEVREQVPERNVRAGKGKDTDSKTSNLLCALPHDSVGCVAGKQ